MPSRDEQNILTDLQHFPDQSLSWERSQIILQNLREEEKRVRGRNRRSKHIGWLAKGLLTCVALLALIWIKPFSTPTDIAGSHALLEEKYVRAAQTAISALGMSKYFQWDEIEKDTEYTIVRTKNREAIVTFIPDTTEVRTVSATYTIHELTDVYQKYVATAQDAMNEANQVGHFQTVHFFKDKEGTTLSFSMENNQFVSVDLRTNQVSDFSIFYRIGDVEKRAILIAKRALLLVADDPNASFTQARKSREHQEEVWTFTHEQENYEVKVGAQTGRVYRVKYVTDHYQIQSIDEVISVFKPLMLSLFGVDITGYQAYGGRDWGGYVLKSEGKPTIVINVADLDIGNIGAISIEW